MPCHQVALSWQYNIMLNGIQVDRWIGLDVRGKSRGGRVGIEEGNCYDLPFSKTA